MALWRLSDQVSSMSQSSPSTHRSAESLPFAMATCVRPCGLRWSTSISSSANWTPCAAWSRRATRAEGFRLSVPPVRSSMTGARCREETTPSRGAAFAGIYITFVFWLAYDTPEGVCVVLQPASSLIHARLVAAMNHEPGTFSEGHELQRKHIRRIPKKLIGRCLATREAQRILNLLEA